MPFGPCRSFFVFAAVLQKKCFGFPVLKKEKNIQNHSVNNVDSLAWNAAQYGCPWVLFSENLVGSTNILRRLDLEELKKASWFPLAIKEGKAKVVTSQPSPELTRTILKKLQVNDVDYVLTNPADLRRIIEHNQDINPAFPPPAGRTPLAKVRTYLAARRSLFALYRTLMAKSRTNLAVVRTGFKFIAIGIVFIRIFIRAQGINPFFFILPVPLLLIGIYMVGSNLVKYLPARKINTVLPPCTCTTPTDGSTVLEAEKAETKPNFFRSAEVPGAAAVRAGWSLLSPVMRRRFLASDRTDFAEERTTLACFRTWMANVRTWLAFVRTGGAFVGLGLGLIRSFPSDSWRFFDYSLVALGFIMISEGLFWYYQGYNSGKEGFKSVKHMNTQDTVWDFFFPHRIFQHESILKLSSLPVRKYHADGIWATTGLALERTVLADRRNLMARLRTVMARIRTGYSFIRTGLTLFFIGAVFAVYFHKSDIYWYCYETVMMLGGLSLIVDGLLWVVPAEKLRIQLPYCFADLEIVTPDYGVPCRS